MLFPVVSIAIYWSLVTEELVPVNANILKHWVLSSKELKEGNVIVLLVSKDNLIDWTEEVKTELKSVLPE